MTEEAREDQLKDEKNPLEGSGGFWDRYGQKVIMGVLAAYLLLLFVGVMAELFDIESVLDWWIWRPPGKGPTGPPT